MGKFSMLFFSAVLFFYSCGGSENKGSENVDSKEEANQIISYTNAVIDYLNSSGDWTRKNESRVNGVLQFVKTGKKPIPFLPFMSNASVNMNKKDVTQPPAVLSEDEKVFFKDKMTLFKSNYDGLRENCSVLYKYLQNQDYKDDKFAKGKELADSINSQQALVSSIRSEVYDKIDVVSAKAESIILADDPLKDPIMALKADLANFGKLYEIYGDYSEGNATPDQVDALYKEVAESLDKNKTAYAELLDEKKVKSKYESFYSTADDLLAKYRKVLRNVKDKKKVTDSDFSSFSSGHNSLVNSYNRFVK